MFTVSPRFKGFGDYNVFISPQKSKLLLRGFVSPNKTRNGVIKEESEEPILHI